MLDAATAGFTLVELMIVVAVLALLTTTLSLSANRPRTVSATDAGRFQTVVAQMREQAVLARQVMGLRLDADGYQRMQWRGGEWSTTNEPARWREVVTVQQPFDARALVQFAPSGQSTAYRLRFDSGDRVTVCESDGWSDVTCRDG